MQVPLPAPAQVLAQFTMPFNREATEKYYDNDAELIDDLVAAYKKVIDDLYEAGCRNVQLDDCTWGMLADKTAPFSYGTTVEGLKEIQQTYKDINNRVIANAPEGVTVATHVCRGNFHSTYASSGAYDAVAEVLFGEENAAGYYLEFDDERSGGFASCEIKNKLTEEQQWAKLKLVKEIAEEVWERKGKSSLLV